MSDLNIENELKKIKLLLLDVDGVLTDGSVFLGTGNVELKAFNIQDGLGIRLAKAGGIEVGIITARTSEAVTLRARELGIDILFQGKKNKLDSYQEILSGLRLSDENVCYMGDDLPDLVLIRKAGFGVAVANACDEVRSHADFTTSREGGRGAVREVIEKILKSQGRWDELIRNYIG